MAIAARQLIHNAVREIGQVLVLRPDAKSPAASKQVEFVLASTQLKEQIATKCHIPTIAGEVSVSLIQAASAGGASAKGVHQSPPRGDDTVLLVSAPVISASEARPSVHPPPSA